MIEIQFVISGQGVTSVQAARGIFRRVMVDAAVEKDRTVRITSSPKELRFAEVGPQQEFPVVAVTEEDPGPTMLTFRVSTEDSVVLIRVPGYGQISVGRHSFLEIDFNRADAVFRAPKAPAAS